MSDPFNVAGRAFVVTGGAGHLGMPICAALANARARVLCVSSKPAVFRNLMGPSCPPPESVVCDVSNEAEFESHIGKFAERCGRLDGLINGAVRAPRGINLDMPRKQFDDGLGTILTQYFTCSRLAVHYMDNGGSIVNMMSMWGLISPDPESLFGSRQ
jgi:2-deoxy-D-gluconate 3-dehydrogenase